MATYDVTTDFRATKPKEVRVQVSWETTDKNIRKADKRELALLTIGYLRQALSNYTDAELANLMKVKV